MQDKRASTGAKKNGGKPAEAGKKPGGGSKSNKKDAAAVVAAAAAAAAASPKKKKGGDGTRRAAKHNHADKGGCQDKKHQPAPKKKVSKDDTFAIELLKEAKMKQRAAVASSIHHQLPTPQAAVVH